MKIINVALGGLIKEDKVLLIKRNKEPYKDMWTLPGGKIEFGEHVEHTIVREFKEETGLDVSCDRVVGLVSEVVKENGDNQHHFHLFVCQLAMEQMQEIVQSAEGEVKWIPITELDQLSIVPSDHYMITNFLLQENTIKIHKVIMEKEGDRYSLHSVR